LDACDRRRDSLLPSGFGLGGVIASFGLVLDLIAFALFLIFILVSSVILVLRQPAVASRARAIRPPAGGRRFG
jgi:hypothetical protein